MRAKDRTHCANGHELTPENTGHDRRKRYCRICKRARFRDWLEGEGHREHRARYWHQWKYNLSQADFDAVVKSQGWCCALCRKPFSSEKGMEPVVDHSHVTEKNRGVIHRKCNMALGLFQDDSVTCRLAGDYLEKYDGK
jgi:hypothetical protein